MTDRPKGARGVAALLRFHLNKGTFRGRTKRDAERWAALARYAAWRRRLDGLDPRRRYVWKPPHRPLGIPGLRDSRRATRRA